MQEIELLLSFEFPFFEQYLKVATVLKRRYLNSIIDITRIVSIRQYEIAFTFYSILD